MNVRYAIDAWRDRRAHPEAPARTGRKRFAHAWRIGRWGSATVEWLPGVDDRVPGADRPWQAGDRARITRRPRLGRTRSHLTREAGIDDALASDLNWGFGWTTADR